MKRTAFSPHGDIYIQHLTTCQKNDMPVQHYHDSYEIYLQLDGKRYLFYDNICYTLERGDMAIFLPFEIHYAESRESDYYERFVLNFREEILQCLLTQSEWDTLRKKLHGCVIHLNEAETIDLYRHFCRAEEYFSQHTFLSEKLLNTAILQLLAKIASYTDKNQTCANTPMDADIVAALRFINGHYRETISLDDIAQAVHMSKFHLCRKFHDTTGATVVEYLNNIRLTKVHDLLLHSHMNINEIAAATGFSAAVNLTRTFKKVYGNSPRDFRKSQRTDSRI